MIFEQLFTDTKRLDAYIQQIQDDTKTTNSLNLIWFDNQTSYNMPSYYVQQLFSLNKGTDVIPITGPPPTPPTGESKKDANRQELAEVISGQDCVWASAVIDRNTNEVIIKLVNQD